MVKYCVANECPIDEGACAEAARNGHLEVLKYLREEAKAPWDWRTAQGRLKMVIFIYSNILLSVSMMNMTNMRVALRPQRPLRLFEVLARNRQSALGLSAVRLAHENNHTRMFTIPPRQRLPFTTRLAIRTWRAAHIVIIIIYIILNTRTFYMLNTHVHFLKIFFSEM